MTPQETITRNLIAAVKVGRCFNGFEKDRGKIVHLVQPLPDGCSGDWFTKALCGAEPGRRGNGWGKAYKDANCQKCLKKYNTNENPPITEKSK